MRYTDLSFHLDQHLNQHSRKLTDATYSHLQSGQIVFSCHGDVCFLTKGLGLGANNLHYRKNKMANGAYAETIVFTLFNYTAFSKNIH